MTLSVWEIRGAKLFALRTMGSLVLVLAFPAVSFSQCPDWSADPAHYTEAAGGGNTLVFYRSYPEDIVIGNFFNLEVFVCQGQETWAGSLSVDATMPAHGHGMNYAPGVFRTEKSFTAEGLLFHMPGQWRLDFGLQDDTGSRHIYSFIEVK